MRKKKQLTFDIDTKVAKQIFGEQNYSRVYADIRGYMEGEGWKHIEGSVYMSTKSIDNSDMFWVIQNMIKRYPYLVKCVREMHQADISKVHSLNHHFEYDGTPGQYEQKQEQKGENHKKLPPKRSSVRDKLKQNQEIIKRQEERQKEQKKQGEIEKEQKPRDRER